MISNCVVNYLCFDSTRVFIFFLKTRDDYATVCQESIVSKAEEAGHFKNETKELMEFLSLLPYLVGG